MDHIVHINNGSGAAKPIVLRLLPGEETIFNLKILNDGEPSNISLLASSPVFKAVRLKKPDHYVVLEEIIPILARMPTDKKRLDGEILLTGSGGESRVPITLLRDSEDPGDDLEDPGMQGDEELKDDEVDEEDVDVYPSGRQGLSRGRDDADYEDDEADYEDDFDRVRGARRLDDEDEEEYESEVTEKEPRRIAFTRDKDLQRYRSATRPRKVSGSPENRSEKHSEKRVQRSISRRADKDREGTDTVGTENRYNVNIKERTECYENSRVERDNIHSNARPERSRQDEIESSADDDDDDSGIENCFRTRIDDRFVDPSYRQEEVPRFIPRQVPHEEPMDYRGEIKEEWAEEREEDGEEKRTEEKMRPTTRYEDRYQGFRQGFEGEARDMPSSTEDNATDRQESYPEEPERYSEQDEGAESIYLDRLSGFGGMHSLKVVPAVLFLALVIVLVMTFIMLSIPEFPGALASSILIVTLIIYGAATLLKA